MNRYRTLAEAFIIAVALGLVLASWKTVADAAKLCDKAEATFGTAGDQQ